MGTFLKPFDPTRQFITQAPFRASGNVWGRGYRFDKSTVNERVLKLLYDQRKIIYDDDPRAIELLTRGKGQGENRPQQRGKTAAQPGGAKARNGDGREGGSPPDAPDTEAEQIKRLMSRHDKTALLDLAKDIPGVHRRMNKTQLSTALVRSGHGDS